MAKKKNIRFKLVGLTNLIKPDFQAAVWKFRGKKFAILLKADIHDDYKSKQTPHIGFGEKKTFEIHWKFPDSMIKGLCRAHGGAAMLLMRVVQSLMEKTLPGTVCFIDAYAVTNYAENLAGFKIEPLNGAWFLLPSPKRLPVFAGK